MKKTYQLVQSMKRNGNSDFVVRNDSQLFNARTLTLVYGEVKIYFYKKITLIKMKVANNRMLYYSMHLYKNSLGITIIQNTQTMKGLY